MSLNFKERCQALTLDLLKDELGEDCCIEIVQKAFTFPIPLKKLTDHISVIELFHGPTLAFKDVGARFMAQAMASVLKKKGSAHPGKFPEVIEKALGKSIQVPPALSSLSEKKEYKTQLSPQLEDLKRFIQSVHR